MAAQRPLTLENGIIRQLAVGDTVIGAGAGSPQPIVTTFTGNLVVTTGIARYYPEQDITLSSVYFSLGTSPSSGSVVIDIKKNGTSVMGGVYPTITPGNYKSTSVVIGVTLSTSDYITVDITSAGPDSAEAVIIIEVATTGSVASALTVKDEGSTLSSAVTSIDFVGSNVTATNTGGAVTVTVTGGSSAPSGDSYWAETVLLARLSDSTDLKGHTVARDTINYVAGKFGNAAYTSTVVTKGVSWANSPDWNLGTGNFTIEFWHKQDSGGTPNPIFWHGADSINDFGILISPNSNNYYVASIYTGAGETGLLTLIRTASGSFATDSTWRHVALVRNGTLFTMYIDGVASGNTATSSLAPYFSSNTRITVGGTSGWQGATLSYVDDLRITKGIARYTSNYSVPTGQLSETGASVLTVKDEGSTLSTAVTSIDFVGSNVSATNTGGAVTVTVTGGGGSSTYFNETDITITSNQSVTTGKNASINGPITLANNVSVDIATGSTWSIIL
jgi:hypothetical protein